jgi:tetratricopeptide repeat protein
VIEQLLEAERMLSVGLLDQAERLYRSVADHDPGSSIAVVGLARVALERGDDRTAYLEARRALTIDPENDAARRMVSRLEEVMAGRGETPPTLDAGSGATPARTQPADSPTPPTPPTQPPAKPRKRRGVVDRLLGRHP